MNFQKTSKITENVGFCVLFLLSRMALTLTIFNEDGSERTQTVKIIGSGTFLSDIRKKHKVTNESILAIAGFRTGVFMSISKHFNEFVSECADRDSDNKIFAVDPKPEDLRFGQELATEILAVNPKISVINGKFSCIIQYDSEKLEKMKNKEIIKTLFELMNKPLFLSNTSQSEFDYFNRFESHEGSSGKDEIVKEILSKAIFMTRLYGIETDQKSKIKNISCECLDYMNKVYSAEKYAFCSFDTSLSGFLDDFTQMFLENHPFEEIEKRFDLESFRNVRFGLSCFNRWKFISGYVYEHQNVLLTLPELVFYGQHQENIVFVLPGVEIISGHNYSLSELLNADKRTKIDNPILKVTFDSSQPRDEFDYNRDDISEDNYILLFVLDYLSYDESGEQEHNTVLRHCFGFLSHFNRNDEVIRIMERIIKELPMIAINEYLFIRGANLLTSEGIVESDFFYNHFQKIVNMSSEASESRPMFVFSGILEKIVRSESETSSERFSNDSENIPDELIEKISDLPEFVISILPSVRSEKELEDFLKEFDYVSKQRIHFRNELKEKGKEYSRTVIKGLVEKNRNVLKKLSKRDYAKKIEMIARNGCIIGMKLFRDTRNSKLFQLPEEQMRKQIVPFQIRNKGLSEIEFIIETIMLELNDLLI